MNIVKTFVLMLTYIIGLAQTHPVPLPQTFSQLIGILRHHTDVKQSSCSCRTAMNQSLDSQQMDRTESLGLFSLAK